MYLRSRSVFVDTEIEKTPINGYELLPVKEIYISIGWLKHWSTSWEHKHQNHPWVLSTFLTVMLHANHSACWVTMLALSIGLHSSQYDRRYHPPSLSRSSRASVGAEELFSGMFVLPDSLISDWGSAPTMALKYQWPNCAVSWCWRTYSISVLLVCRFRL